MNNTPPTRPPNRRPPGRPPQKRGKNPNRPPNRSNPPRPQNRNPNPNNGAYPPPQNPYSYNPYGQPPQQQYPQYPPYPQQPYGAPYGQPDPEILRRRRELERRQAEARRQAARDRERREKQRRKAERERRFRHGLKILGGRLLVFAVILILLCAFTGLIFLLCFHHTPDKPDTSGNMTYFYGGSEVRKTPMEEAVADGIVYLCFNDLADYLGMKESGSAEALKFILPMSDEIPQTAAGTGTEEIICFYTDSINVEINGQSAQLDLPNIIRGTEVWVASEFVTEYISNLSCQYNERKSTITVSRIADEENSTEDETVFLPVSFKLKNSDALEPLPEEDILGSQQ